VEYAHGGGTVVMSYCFSSNMYLDDMEEFWSKAWGLPWEPASYHRTYHTLNQSSTTLKGQVEALLNMYSQKALSLKNVKHEHSWYLPTDDSVTQSAVFAPERVSRTETAVAFAPCWPGLCRLHRRREHGAGDRFGFVAYVWVLEGKNSGV
jgi:hypothetical protein